MYGLGAILYEILAARAPLVGTTVRDVLTQVECGGPVRPTALVPAVPADLETACLRALSKNPDDRHATAGELVAQEQMNMPGPGEQQYPLGPG